MTEPAALRAALIGYGLSGRFFHAPFLTTTPGLRLSSIVTSDSQRKSQAQADHPGVTVFNHPDDLWARAGEHDLVVVATATPSHASLAIQAIEARLPVVVEKPLAPDARTARALADLARLRGIPLTVFHNRRWDARAALDPSGGLIPLTVFHNRRWDSDQCTLRLLLAAGKLGRVYRYESRFERWRPDARPGSWRDRLATEGGGGVLLDLGSHLVDQAIELFGAVTHVYAEVVAHDHPADNESFVAMTHSCGVRSHLSMGSVFAGPGPRLRVLGSRAAFIVEHLDGQEAALRAGRLPSEPAFGTEAPESFGQLHIGNLSEVVPSEPGRWQSFYSSLVESLTEGTPLPVDALDAVKVVEVLDAARRSSESHTVQCMEL
jgi:predicted dehydrogenase